jgi:8-oxo-dGTP pyrophosphatase MutT (NUDIX family)
MMEDLKREVRKKLTDSPRRRVTKNYSAEAAVLIGIFQREGEPYFLLTQRTQEVATHKGQISFPGGRRDERDSSLLETALRETEEEVGIAADWVEILGQCDEYRSKTNLLVAPYVGFLKAGFTVFPNPREVERILEVPLHFFSQTTPREEFRQRHGKQMTLYFYEYELDVVWGLTAAIIRDLMKLLG